MVIARASQLGLDADLAGGRLIDASFGRSCAGRLSCPRVRGWQRTSPTAEAPLDGAGRRAMSCSTGRSVSWRGDGRDHGRTDQVLRNITTASARRWLMQWWAGSTLAGRPPWPRRDTAQADRLTVEEDRHDGLYFDC